METRNKSVRARAAEPAPDMAACRSGQETLARVGDKWTMIVLATLSRRTPMRYGELRRAITGISQRMLTLTLKGLEREGLVARTVHPTIPPQVEYALSDLGRTLIVPLRAVHRWTVENRAATLEARKAYAQASAKRTGATKREPAE